MKDSPKTQTFEKKTASQYNQRYFSDFRKDLKDAPSEPIWVKKAYAALGSRGASHGGNYSGLGVKK